jgi:hypothetical protein
VKSSNGKLAAVGSISLADFGIEEGENAPLAADFIQEQFPWEKPTKPASPLPV